MAKTKAKIPINAAMKNGVDMAFCWLRFLHR